MVEDSLYAIYLDNKEILMLVNQRMSIIKKMKASLDKGISSPDILKKDIPKDMDYKEAISITSIAVHLLTQEEPGEKIEQFLSTLTTQRDKCEKLLSEVIDRMRRSNNPDCQRVVMFLGTIPEGKTLSEGVLLMELFEKSYEYMQNKGYTYIFEDFGIELGAELIQGSEEQSPSGEDFPGTSGRRK